MQMWIRSGFVALFLVSSLFVQISIAAEADKGTDTAVETPGNSPSGKALENQLEIISLEAKRVFGGGTLFWKWTLRFKNQLSTTSPEDLTVQCHQEVNGNWRSVGRVSLPPTAPGEEGEVGATFPLSSEDSRLKAQIYSKSESKYISNEKIIVLPSLAKKPSAPPARKNK